MRSISCCVSYGIVFHRISARFSFFSSAVVDFMCPPSSRYSGSQSLALAIMWQVEMSGMCSSGCHAATCATRFCRRVTSVSLHANMLSPSFFAASHIILMTSSLSALCIGLELTVSLPILLSVCISTHPCLLSHATLSRCLIIESSRSSGLSGAARNTRPAEVEALLSEAIANHSCAACESFCSSVTLAPLASL